MSTNTRETGAKQAPQIVTEPDALRSYMRRADFRKMLEDSMASNVDMDRLVRVAVSCLMKDPKLQECSLLSLGQAIADAARIGLEPGISVLGHCWLVPFEAKSHEHCDHESRVFRCEKRGVEAQLIVGYKGKEELFRRSGWGSRLVAREVRKNDTYEPEGGTADRLVHRWKMEGRGPVIGYYAVAFFKDGATAFEDMTVAQVEDVRRNYSKSADSPAWTKSFDEMAKAKVCHRLDKHLPMSVEQMHAHDLDDEEHHIVQASSYEVVGDAPAPGPSPAPQSEPQRKVKSPALARAQSSGGVQIPQRETAPANGQVPPAGEASPPRPPAAPIDLNGPQGGQHGQRTDAMHSNRPAPEQDSSDAPSPGTPVVPPATPPFEPCTSTKGCVRKAGHEVGRCSSKEKDRGN